MSLVSVAKEIRFTYLEKTESFTMDQILSKYTGDPDNVDYDSDEFYTAVLQLAEESGTWSGDNVNDLYKREDQDLLKKNTNILF